LEAARLVRYDTFNAQQQPKITWPAGPVVARAYLDQLTRSRAIQPQRAAALKSALDAKNRAQLLALANQLEQDAATAQGRDAQRMKALAAVINGM
jgi:hypothetical protein